MMHHFNCLGKKFETILSNAVYPKIFSPRTLVAVAVEPVVVSDRRLRNNLVTFLDFCNLCHQKIQSSLKSLRKRDIRYIEA